MADAAARSFARDCNAAAATVVALSTAYGYGGSSNDAACAAAAQGAAVEFAPSFNVSEVTSDPSCQISNATFDGFAAIATCEAYAANLTAFCGTPPDRALAAILDRIKARKEEEEARAAGLVRAKARANVVVSGMADVKTSCNGASSSAGAVDNAVFVGDWLPPPDRTSPLLGAGLGGGGVGSKAGGGSGGGARCGGGRGGGSGGSAGCSVRGGRSAGGGDVGGGGTVAADGVGDDRRAALRTHKPTHRSAPVRKQQEREPSPVRQHRTAPMLQVLMTPRDRLTGSDEEARRERERFLQNQHTGWR